MAISEWWNGHPEQRFWMEATSRTDLGEDLRSPKESGTGRGFWHYDLVSLTKPGDIIFHWHTELLGRPALVGWSEVLGELREEFHPWVPHAGRSYSVPSLEPRANWVMPLGGLHLLDRPIFGSDMESIREPLLNMKESLGTKYSGFKYFPFSKYQDTHVRAVQAYLTKFPAELVDLLSGGFDLELGDVAGGVVEPELQTTKPIRPGSGQGFLQDTARKMAIEQHAVTKAIAFYEGIGATQIEVLGKPYDLRLQLGGREVHVEVKGSSNIADTVQVTRNEVAHAREHSAVELVVVDSVEWLRDSAGEVLASGGRVRRWAHWLPTDDSLSALAFTHVLPQTGFTTH